MSEATAQAPGITVESGRFRMGAGKFASTMIFRYAYIPLLLLSAVGVAGIVTGAFTDWRYIIVGLMVVLVAIPALLAFYYYSYGLKRECFVNAVEHTLVVCREGIRARIIVPAFTRIAADGTETEVEERIREEFFPWSAMRGLRRTPDGFTLDIRTPGRGFIWVPESAFSDPAQMDAAYALAVANIPSPENRSPESKKPEQ